MDGPTKIPLELADNVAFLLNHATKDYEIYFDNEMRDLKLTRAQMQLLANLYFLDGINQQDLAEVMVLSKSAMGRLAERLENSGWIERLPCTRDGRAFNLRIKKRARPIVKKLVDLMLLETKRYLSEFSADEIKLLKSFLHRIRRSISEVPTTQKWQSLKAEAIADAKKLGY